MEKTKKITFHVISHTHWDREWYFPFEVFRIELVELIDNLLNILEQNKDFIFHLDGQSIVLLDYLEIKPHKREQIKKFVKSGNLLIGPWYVLSDQFLTSGEATVRNLLYGIRDTNGFGNTMLVGYCPDQFGQIAQLPQIFKSFNIDTAIVGRGIQDSIAEHNWYGLNGEHVLAISLTNWYNNAQRLPNENKKLHKYLDKIYETQAKTSSSKHILLMNGCDHLFPQEDLIKITKSITTNQKWDLKVDDLESTLCLINASQEQKNFPIRFGELRDDNNKYILAGTLSSRVYLKLENYKCETKLEKIIEPLATLLTLNKKVKYPYDEIKYTWRLLIQNHAHDSICGCSIDEVHHEMEIRFLKVNQVLDKLLYKIISSLNKSPQLENESYLQVINLTNIQRKDLIETELELPLGPPAEHPSANPTMNKKEIKNLIMQYHGKKVDSKILENYRTYKMVRSKDEVPLLQAIQKIKILFEANMEPFSIKTYEIEERAGELENWRAGEEDQFENKSYKLSIKKNGTLSITLKENNFKFENLHYLSIEDDLGDEYNFVPNTNPQSPLEVAQSLVKLIEENQFRKKFLLSFKDKDLEIETEITCYQNTDRIDFVTKTNNKLKNKRIRLHFPTELNTNYISADTPFGVIERARPPLDWTNCAYSQALYNWIDHSNDKVGLAFFGGGLADYELYEDGNSFTITLIRAVGKLSSVKSHSLIETPDAQCNREIKFSYAIYPHLGNWVNAHLQNEQLIYQIPIITNQCDLKYELPSLISTSPELITSSLKRSEDKENLYILRLFNPYDKALKGCKLNINFSSKNLYKLNLNEEIENTLKVKEGQVNFEVQPYQILTFGIEV